MHLDLVQIRRDLHQIPEIGLEEHKTHAYLLDKIAIITAGKEFVEQRTWRTGICDSQREIQKLSFIAPL